METKHVEDYDNIHFKLINLTWHSPAWNIGFCVLLMWLIWTTINLQFTAVLQPFDYKKVNNSKYSKIQTQWSITLKSP